MEIQLSQEDFEVANNNPDFRKLLLEKTTKDGLFCFLVLGQTQVGKSSLIKKLLTKNCTESDIQTPQVGEATKQVLCTVDVKQYKAKVDKMEVSFIDTPGLLEKGRSTEDILESVYSYLVQEKIKPNGIIYVSKFTDNVMKITDQQVIRSYLDFFRKRYPHIQYLKTLNILSFAGPDVSSLPGGSTLSRDATKEEKIAVWQCHLQVRKEQLQKEFGDCEVVPIDNRLDYDDLIDGTLWFETLLKTFLEYLSYHEKLTMLCIMRKMKEQEDAISELEKKAKQKDLDLITRQEKEALLSVFLAGLASGSEVAAAVAKTGIEIANVGGSLRVLMYGAAWDLVGIGPAVTTVVSTPVLALAGGAAVSVVVGGLAYMYLKKVKKQTQKIH